MKVTRKLIAFVLVLIMCCSFVLSVSAAMAGIYSYVKGEGSQSGSILVTRTYVGKNPDSAFLTTSVDFSDGVNHMGNASSTSGRGVTSYSHNFPIYMTADHIPTRVYCTHAVQGGSQSASGYAEYNVYYISV